MRIIAPSVSVESLPTGQLKVIEAAGRTCYKSDPKGSPEQFVESLITRGHESVIEHSFAAFRIVCSRGVSHELVRHRLAAFSQESTRYCNYADDRFDNEISVIMPPEFEGDVAAVGWWEDSIEQAEESYCQLLALGHKPQIAREVLPTCLKTEMVMSGNFREWRHVIKLRTSEKAHPHARFVASEIKRLLSAVYPVITEDL